MGRPTYVCTTCSEHFTRKYSAKRHNLTVHHNNGGEIVRLVEYLVGRSSGKYQASHPSWYRPSEKSIHKFGRAMIADSVEDAFRTEGLQRPISSAVIGGTRATSTAVGAIHGAVPLKLLNTPTITAGRLRAAGGLSRGMWIFLE